MDAVAKAKTRDICCDYGWWWARINDPMEIVHPLAADGLADIAVPVLTIAGEHDAAACLEVADLLAHQVPRNTRVDIAGNAFYADGTARYF